MAKADPLVDQTFYGELEGIQQHAEFLTGQIKDTKQEILFVRDMVRRDTLSSEDDTVLRQLQERLMEKLNDLDKTTRQVQVLLSLPAIESDAIEIDTLEADRLGAKPFLPTKSSAYRILQRVPNILLVGNRTLIVSSTVTGGDTNDLEEGNSATNTQDEDEAEVDPEMELEKEQELERENEKKKIQELHATEKLLMSLASTLEKKQSQIISLEKNNSLMKKALEQLATISDDDDNNFDPNKPFPIGEDDMEKIIRATENKRKKIVELITKAEHETCQQQRANCLIHHRNSVLKSQQDPHLTGEEDSYEESTSSKEQTPSRKVESFSEAEDLLSKKSKDIGIL